MKQIKKLNQNIHPFVKATGLSQEEFDNKYDTEEKFFKDYPHMNPSVQKMEYGGKPGYYFNGEKFVKSKGTGTFNNGVYFKDGGKWIQKAIKHPGRCTPGSPNYDCPKGSPQWNLAQRFKHGDLHKKEYGLSLIHI